MIIVLQVNAPLHMAQGVKEAVAMHLERFGDTMKALHQMGEKAHTQPYKEPVAIRSVFLDCPCTKCIDGGIDMPHCVDCSRSNGFPYFRNRRAEDEK